MFHEQIKIVSAFGGKVFDKVHEANSTACDHRKSSKDHDMT